MTDWLIELANTTVAPAGEVRIASTVVADLGPLWGLLPDRASLRAGAEGALSGLIGSTTVCQHCDLGPWNTLVDGDTICVIDWADAEPSGHALCDLYHFLAHLVLCAMDAYGPDQRQGFIDQLVDENTELGRLVDRCLRRYASALQLGEAEVRSRRVLTWLLDLLRRPLSDQVESIYLDLLRAELR